jgi:glycyl-tRNA synthetase beta subunit
MQTQEYLAQAELWRVYQVAQQQMDGSVASLACALRMLQEPINNFFIHVYVNTNDMVVRRARLALLQHIAALANGIADLSLLQGY